MVVRFGSRALVSASIALMALVSVAAALARHLRIDPAPVVGALVGAPAATATVTIVLLLAS